MRDHVDLSAISVAVHDVPSIVVAGVDRSQLPDLSSLSDEQQTVVVYLAQREAAALVRMALQGANERIELALQGGMLKLPIFHLEDVARLEAAWSAGKAAHVTGASS